MKESRGVARKKRKSRGANKEGGKGEKEERIKERRER